MPKGGSDRSTSSGSPENISSSLLGYRIENDTIITPNGRTIIARDFREPTRQALDLARQHGLEDPVLVGQGVVPRSVAEIAIQQGVQARANYESNLALNVAGLQDLMRAKIEQEDYRHSLNVAIERGYSRAPEKPVNRVPELTRQYPRAVAYLKAQSFASASNFEKAATGKRAMEDIRMGKNIATVMRRMQREWDAIARRDSNR